MRKSRFAEEHNIGIYKEVEAGANLAELCRRHEISKERYYRWRAGDLPRQAPFGKLPSTNSGQAGQGGQVKFAPTQDHEPYW